MKFEKTFARVLDGGFYSSQNRPKIGKTRKLKSSLGESPFSEFDSDVERDKDGGREVEQELVDIKVSDSCCTPPARSF
jgi:hypothetical protein